MDALNQFLAFNELTIWHWWTLAIVLLGLEIATGTTYLLWPAAAAAVVGLIAGPTGWELQLFVFAALTTVLTLAGDRFVRKRWMTSDKPTLNQINDQLVGQRVVAADAFSAGLGRVRVGDTVWRARLEGDDAIEAGAVLEVTGLDGVTLSVRRPIKISAH